MGCSAICGTSATSQHASAAAAASTKMDKQRDIRCVGIDLGLVNKGSMQFAWSDGDHGR